MLYAIANLREVRLLNTDDATSLPIGNLAFPSFSIARDASTDLLYYIETGVVNNTGDNIRVATFNPETGENNIIGTIGSQAQGVQFFKLAQAGNGTFFALGTDTDLYTIDPTTGEATDLGTITGGNPPYLGGSGDAVFDPNDPNQLFVISTGTAGYRLYRVDITNPNAPVATFVGDTGLSSVGSGSLGFDGNGNLFASSGTSVYQIDTTTAAASFVGDTGFTLNDFAFFNTNPVATDELLSTTINTPVEIPVLGNDFDPDGDPISISTFDNTSASGGSVTLNLNGTPNDASDDLLVYTPATNFAGTDTFTYTITDTNGGSGTATVSVDVNNVIPTVTDDLASTTVNTSVEIAVLVNDSEGVTINSFDTTSSNGGSITINDNGTSNDATDDFLVYTPATNFAGTDTFTYTVVSETGGTATGTATVTVDVINNNPTARNDLANTQINTPVTINVLENDQDPDGGLTIGNFDTTTANGGTIVLDNNNTPDDASDDNLVYTPATGFIGADEFTYTVDDGSGGTSTATVNVNVRDNQCGIGDDLVLIGGDSEATLLRFALADASASLVNEFGVFRVDDDFGTINGIAPGEEGYISAALSSGQRIFSDLSETRELFDSNPTRIVEGFQSGDRLGFYLIQNDSSDQVLTELATGETDANIFFGITGANTDSFDHLDLTTNDDGSLNLAWEDQFGGGDRDFNDVVINFSVTSNPPPLGNLLQGGFQQEVIDLTQLPGQNINGAISVQGNSNLANSGGLYQLADASGSVIDPNTGEILTPGADGYAQAALAQSIIQFGEDEQVDSFNLEGGFIYAPYILTGDGTPYFPFIGANEDGSDHLRLLADNTFGYEDGINNSDFDFNDLVFRVNLPTLAEVGLTPQLDTEGTAFLTPLNPDTGSLVSNEDNLITISGADDCDAHLQFVLTQANATNINELGVFLVDDDAGTIEGIAPGEGGYLEAALNRGQIVFSALNGSSGLGLNPTRVLDDFTGGERLGFYLIQDSTTDQVLAQRAGGNTSTNVFFSLADANSDNFDHLQINPINDESLRLSWEDEFGGGDGDFNDLELVVEFTGKEPSLGMASPQTNTKELLDFSNLTGEQVQVTLAVQSNGTLSSVGGFYQIIDNSGTVIDPVTGNSIAPGEAGYTEAAIALSQTSGVQYTSNDTSVTAVLAGGALYAPFLQVDTQDTYFSFLNENADGLDHVLVLGDNTFGFEDLLGGGDGDFNDLIVAVEASVI